MGFWGLFEVASMPILQVLIVSAVGAIMATDYLNLLPTNTINSLNKIVFVIFTPSLIFASLVETVTFEDIISWWFMPINIGLTFLFGGILGWIAIKLIKPKPHLEGLIMAMCSTGNFANLLLIMVPAICTDDGSPFGDHSVCKAKGLSYASFSMALGSFYTWTCTYQLIQGSALRFNSMKETEKLLNEANKDLDANQNTRLLSREDHDNIDRIIPSSNLTSNDTENQRIAYEGSIGNEAEKDGPFSDRLVEILKKLVEQLLAPPTIGSGWNHTLSYPHIRREPHKRSTKGKRGAHNHYDSHRCSLLDSSHNRHRCDQNGGNSWVASIGSPLQIRVVDHVCSASRCEYQYNGTVV